MSSLLNIDQGCTVLIDKPLDWTSFDVVNKIRGVLSGTFHRKKIKVGHAGTLDPRASGLLIICIGRHTKMIQSFQDFKKRYTGTLELGKTTPTYDTESEPDAYFDISHITPELIEKTRQQFVGFVEQYPPQFSAVKVDGVTAYKAARSGRKVEMKSRTVQIDQLDLTNTNLPYIDFDVICSKGTYIRSLAYDFGNALQSGAYLTSLRRTEIGPFQLNNAWSLDAFIQYVESHQMDPLKFID